MAEKYLLFSLEDESSKKLGEIISNPTCNKIMNLLAEKELSETEISKELSLPLNTIDYNIKNLLKSGLLEKANKWWSVKGRKIDTFRLANKMIVISPKKTLMSKLGNIIPVAILAGIFTAGVAYYTKGKEILVSSTPPLLEAVDKLATSGASAGQSAMAPAAQETAKTITLLPPEFQPWLWFLIGSLSAILIFSVWNWKRMK
jgi:DNA-binding transcriptional ArsR family regulator